jgi:hypothetical protein
MDLSDGRRCAGAAWNGLAALRAKPAFSTGFDMARHPDLPGGRDG